MPAWWTPEFTSLLLPAALVGVPVIAGGIFAVGQGWRRKTDAAREIAARSTVYWIVSVVFVLAGLFEWGIGANQAVLARTLIADYPAEFWRWINMVIGPVLWGGLLCGLGAHAVCTWRRIRAQPKSF